MVSIHKVPVIVHLIIRVISSTFRFKRGASLCHSLHVLRPWNCPISRNEQRRKPHDDIYSQQTRTTSHNIRLQKMFRMQCIYTPQGVPVALFLTDHLNFPGSKTSKPKRTVTPFYVYVSHPCFSP